MSLITEFVQMMTVKWPWQYSTADKHLGDEKEKKNTRKQKKKGRMKQWKKEKILYFYRLFPYETQSRQREYESQARHLSLPEVSNWPTPLITNTMTISTANTNSTISILT